MKKYNTFKIFEIQNYISWHQFFITASVSLVIMLLTFKWFINHPSILLSAFIFILLVISIWFLNERKEATEKWFLLTNIKLSISSVIGIWFGFSIYYILSLNNIDIIVYRYFYAFLLIPLIYYTVCLLLVHKNSNEESECKVNSIETHIHPSNSKIYFNTFDGDKPIVNFESDKLKRSEFARNIAQHIINEPDIPMVYGINGMGGR